MLALLVLLFSTAVQARTTLNFDLNWLFKLGDEGNAPPAPVCNATRWPLNLTNYQCYGLSRAGSFQSADACCAAGLAANANVWQYCPLTGCGGGANMPGDCWTGGLAGLTDCGHSEPGWVSFALNETLPPPGPRPPPPPPVCPGDRACKDFDDSSWRKLNVPHDWVVEGSPDPKADRNHGYLPFNISWYRKHFTVDPSWQGQPIWLDFDGVYRSSDFYLNGEFIGHWESGYAPFRWYIHNSTSGGLFYGADNVLSVRVDALSFQEGWFYEGGGIYRSCTLNTAPTTNLVPWGVYIPSVLTGAISSPFGLSGQQTAASAYVPLFIDVQNSKTSGTINDSFTLTATLVDAGGGVVGSTSGGGSLPPGGWARITPPPMNPTNVNLWSPSTPYLYTMVVTLTGPGGSVDSVNTTIGLRSAIFDANAGFLMNGLPLQIQGFSQHGDFGGLGSAAVPRVAQARVAAVKALGCQGWRTAHNPVATEILDATDRMGVLVWSENRNLERQVIGTPRRMTQAQVGGGGAAAERESRSVAVGGAQHPALNAPIDPTLFPDPQYLLEAAQMVLRDRNHPSIIIWSLCNEGGCMQGNPLGGIVASAFKNTILNIDTMRPITANSEDYPGDTLTRVMDIEAFSYNYGEYDGAHRRYPWKPVIGGESASCVSDRGYYGPQNATTGHINADDIGCVVNAWQSVGTRPWVLGNFAWTGMDYKGEPSPLNWPDINSHFGVLDIAAFEKDSAGYYKAWWLNDTTHVYLLPNSWNFPPGPLPIPITVFAVAPYAELFVNGVSQGIKSIPPYGVATWGAGIEWVAGNLSAVSYSLTNATLATTTIFTTGPPTALRLTADFDSATIAANAQDVALLRLEVVDASGAMVPDASPPCTWTVDGGGAVGEIVGLANGDPSDLTPDKVGNPELPYGGVWTRNAYHGLARGIVQSTGTTPGTVTVTVKSPGLTDATFTVTTV